MTRVLWSCDGHGTLGWRWSSVLSTVSSLPLHWVAKLLPDTWPRISVTVVT